MLTMPKSRHQCKHSYHRVQRVAVYLKYAAKVAVKAHLMHMVTKNLPTLRLHLKTCEVAIAMAGETKALLTQRK